MSDSLSPTIESESELEDLLSEPTEAVVRSLERLTGDVIVLGAGGKMGLSLARMLRRATARGQSSRRILAVSRFSRPGQADRFRDAGIETLSGDLLEESFVASLPRAANVIFMTGMKFGADERAAQTWAMNVYLPALICRQFPASRVLAFSTGNVYPFVTRSSGGSLESDRLAPVGEYGMSALGRERMFEYFSRRDGLPMTIVRLNYAVEMRYGVLVDLARQVYDGVPIDLSMGFANVIWQGDANAHALCALADAAVPPFVVNVAGPELVDVREVCLRFGERFGRAPEFVNDPAETALLNNAEQAHRRYGLPRVSLERLIDWTANWIASGHEQWDKPTHFQTRDGRF